MMDERLRREVVRQAGYYADVLTDVMQGREIHHATEDALIRRGLVERDRCYRVWLTPLGNEARLLAGENRR
jgi:hypothetical protein